ncbi:MAG: hypothetical protein Kow0069_31280 [Promethearchaeota archaeon]
MSSLFKRVSCDGCGESFPPGKLEKFKEERLCAGCLKKKKAADKKKCPHCGKSYANLERHLPNCKENPANATNHPVGGKAPKKTSVPPGVTAGPRVDAALVEATRAELASAKSAIADLRDRLERIQSDLTATSSLVKEFPRALSSSIGDLVEAVKQVAAKIPDLRAFVATPASKNSPGRPADATPNVGTHPGRSLAKVPPMAATLKVIDQSTFPVDASVNPPVLAGDPASHVAAALIKSRAKPAFLAAKDSGDWAALSKFFDPPLRNVRRTLNWGEVLRLALASSAWWFTSCHSFAAFLTLLQRSLQMGLQTLSGQPNPSLVDGMLSSFRALAWKKFAAWQRAGLDVTWTDVKLGKPQALRVAEWLVCNQNRPQPDASLALAVKGVEWSRLGKGPRSNFRRYLRSCVQQGWLKERERSFWLAETLGEIRLSPAFVASLGLEKPSSAFVARSVDELAQLTKKLEEK